MRTLTLTVAAALLMSVHAGTAPDGTGPDSITPAVRRVAALPLHDRGRLSLAGPAPAQLPLVRPSLAAAAAGEIRPALPPEAAAIRWCESRDDYRAENPTSSASGAWQFIDSTFEWVTGLQPPASAHPRHVQDAAFLALWDDGAGAQHWEPSRHCWEPLIQGAWNG